MTPRHHGQALRRADGVLTQQVGDEYVVVHPDTQQAHALGGAAAAVWASFDSDDSLPGEYSQPEIDVAIAHLVELDVVVPEGTSRRAILRRAGLVTAGVGIASIGLPTIGAAASGITGSASISLTPITGPRGTIVTVAGTNFFPSGTISTVTIGGLSVTPSNTTVSGTGQASFTITVPNGTTVGADAVVVTDNHNNSASQTFTVTSPTLMVTPASGPDGATVTISSGTGASGFLPGANYTAKFDSTTLTLTGNAGIDGTGKISGSPTFVVPSGTVTGSHTVTVTDSAGNVGTATFTVNSPTLTLTPVSGPDGSTVTISSASGTTGFAPGGTYTAKFDSATLALTGNTGIGVSGQISGTPTFTVPDGTAPGTHSVSVTDSAGNVGTATFTVSAPTATTTSLAFPRNGSGSFQVTASSGFLPGSTVTVTNTAGYTITPSTVTATGGGAISSTQSFAVTYPNGSHSGVIRFTDSAGNTIAFTTSA